MKDLEKYAYFSNHMYRYFRMMVMLANEWGPSGGFSTSNHEKQREALITFFEKNEHRYDGDEMIKQFMIKLYGRKEGIKSYSGFKKTMKETDNLL